MRILMVHDAALEGGYGAERYVARLVAGLEAAGDEVDVVAGEIQHRGAARLRDVWDPAARRLVAERIERFRPDVVHHHNIARELSATVLSAADAPQVMTVHDQRLLGAREHAWFTPHGGWELLGAATVRRAARRRLAATIGVSEPVSDLLRRRGFPAVTTVPVPAPDRLVESVPVDRCHDLVVLARLAPDKGVDVVLQAFRRLVRARRLPDAARLMIAGDGPAAAELHAAAAELGDRVRFLGVLAEPAVSRLLATARVVVVASIPQRRPEGSSMTLVEAAAHGRPVVGSDDPAVRHLADSLGNTVVVPSADPDAMADAIARLFDDPAEATRLGAAGLDAVECRHSIAAVTAATQAVYRTVVRG